MLRKTKKDNRISDTRIQHVRTHLTMCYCDMVISVLYILPKYANTTVSPTNAKYQDFQNIITLDKYHHDMYSNQE